VEYKYKKPNRFIYGLTRFLSWCTSRFLYRCKIVRNELKGKKGPIVVLANHQAKLDFVNLIGVTREPMSFVVSNSFYQTLPVKGAMDKIGVIPKQQFQTTLKDMHMMKAVIDAGKILAIYPAGLMCEDGRSTPIPVATARFVQWLHADVYMARSFGTYFCTPKWSRRRRSGTTYLDVYKLFSAEELKTVTPEELTERINNSLDYDAYREQESLKVEFSGGEDVEGLENVLCICPSCHGEFTTKTERNRIFCTECGYEAHSDRCGFLTPKNNSSPYIRYVSDWARMVFEETARKMDEGELTSLSAKCRYMTVDNKCHKFTDAGEGTITLTYEHFTLEGTIGGEEISLNVPIASFASLPFVPGKYIEIQHHEDIYRCMLEDGRLAMKFINMIKHFYELHQAAHAH